MSVRLLFDQNLSPKLVERLNDVYPNSVHVDRLGLGAAADSAVWQYARENGLTIVTKDADFADLCVLRGYPPKILWIRRGNCSTAAIESLLRDYWTEIETLVAEQSIGGILALM